jgi:uncharacterized damage-inducible protein DinB
MDLTYLLRRWQNVRAGLIETMDKFQAHELDFLPYTSSRSVRHIMLHIAHEEYGEFAYGIAQTLNEFPAEYNPQGYTSKEDVKVLLESVHRQTLSYLQKLTDPDLTRVIHTPWGASHRLVEMVDHMIEHEVHHRGELSLILGILGREGFDA